MAPTDVGVSGDQAQDGHFTVRGLQQGESLRIIGVGTDIDYLGGVFTAGFLLNATPYDARYSSEGRRKK